MRARGAGFSPYKRRLALQITGKSAYFLSCQPWNKGKLVGQKPPLQPKHVWAVRTRLRLSNHKRDLALFNLAIDSKQTRQAVDDYLAQELKGAARAFVPRTFKSAAPHDPPIRAASFGLDQQHQTRSFAGRAQGLEGSFQFTRSISVG